MKRALLLLLLAGCRNETKSEPAPPVPTAAPASASVSAPAAPVDKPWFEGAWQGTFDAALYRIEMPTGGVKEWKSDDGKQASGKGQLAVEVSADGTASGVAKGALGELTVSGRFEGDRAALSLAPVTPGGFQGVILAARSGEDLKGPLSASSGDSLQVRRADVTLSRVAK